LIEIATPHNLEGLIQPFVVMILAKNFKSILQLKKVCVGGLAVA
jgi:hypothetical protein